MVAGDKLTHKTFKLDAVLLEFLCLPSIFFRLLLKLMNLPFQISIKLSTMFWVLGIESRTKHSLHC